MSESVSLSAPAVGAADGDAKRVRPPRERPIIGISGLVATAPELTQLPTGEKAVAFTMFAGRESPAPMVLSFPGDATGEKASRFADQLAAASKSLDAGAEGVHATLAGKWRKGEPTPDGKSNYWFQGIDAAVGKDVPLPAVVAAAEAAKLKEAAAVAPAKEPAVARAAQPDQALLAAQSSGYADVRAVEAAIRAGKPASTKDPNAFMLIVSGDQAKGVSGDALASVAPLALQARDAGRDVRLHGGFRSALVPYGSMAAKLVRSGPDVASEFLRDLPAAAEISKKNAGVSHALYRASKARANAGVGAGV